jgi:hypothetical protein
MMQNSGLKRRLVGNGTGEAWQLVMSLAVASPPP